MSEEIGFLKELQKELRTQEIDSQAAPRYWAIMDYRIVPGNEDYDNGEYSYIFNDGDHKEFKNFEELREFLEDDFGEEVENDHELREIIGAGVNESDEFSIRFDELWEYVEEKLNDEGYFSKVFVKEEEFIVPNTMFLTKEEAKKHLQLNDYHYTQKAHTYAMTAWRAPKVRRLFEILESFDWDSINQQSVSIVYKKE